MTQRYMHLSPAALDAAIRLLEQPAGPPMAGRTVKVLETVWRRGGPQKRSIKTGGKLAVRQGFEPYDRVFLTW